MNRRDFLKRTLAVSAAGLLVPVAEPVRRVWALDRTMVAPPPIITPGRLVGDPFTCVTDSQGITYLSSIPVGSWIRELHTDGYWREHVFTGRGWTMMTRGGEDRPLPRTVLEARNGPRSVTSIPSGTFVVVDRGQSFLQQRVIVSDDGTMIATP